VEVVKVRVAVVAEHLSTITFPVSQLPLWLQVVVEVRVAVAVVRMSS